MRPRHAEATPSEAYIKGRGLAWPLQLESCSYAYVITMLHSGKASGNAQTLSQSLVLII